MIVCCNPLRSFANPQWGKRASGFKELEKENELFNIPMLFSPFTGYSIIAVFGTLNTSSCSICQIGFQHQTQLMLKKCKLFVTFKSSAWREIWLKCSELGFWEGNGIAFDRSFKLAEYHCNSFNFVWNPFVWFLYEEVQKYTLRIQLDS